ncbi:phage tail protein [Vibrio rumoiensis]|uniref:phage tail protein n=1 Tax=Vibrio rumoiensis TaxID=76258 RepID=UPI003AA8329D
MAGLNTQMEIDTEFIQKLAQFPKLISQSARKALSKTNTWLRSATMVELGYELRIDKKAMNSRFRVYKSGHTTRLWIGINDIAVHRLGKPVQKANGVQVGDHFFEKAFISPMNSDELLVWRRTGKQRSQIEMVKLDVSDEAEEIIGSYAPEINRKFREYFHVEFQRALSRA